MVQEKPDKQIQKERLSRKKMVKENFRQPNTEREIIKSTPGTQESKYNKHSNLDKEGNTMYGGWIVDFPFRQAIQE